MDILRTKFSLPKVNPFVESLEFLQIVSVTFIVFIEVMGLQNSAPGNPKDPA